MSNKYCPKCFQRVSPVACISWSPWICACGWCGHPSQALNEVPPVKGLTTYVSIDLETTGLDPESCQILEVGAVYEDWTRPLAQLPVFHRYIVHDSYCGQPYALAMNAKILSRLSGDTTSEDFCYPEEIEGEFTIWLADCGWDTKTAITPAGKNFSGFDLPFLRKVGCPKLKHRALDPAMFYWRPLEDETLPDTQTCMERAGISGPVAHTAVEDALVVVELIRIGARRVL